MNNPGLSQRAAFVTLSLMATTASDSLYAQASISAPASKNVVAAVNPMEIMRPLPPRPARWIEDYRFLDDESKRNDFFDPIRYNRLSDSAWI